MFAFRTIVVNTVLLFLALVAGPYVAVQLNYLAGPISLGWFRAVGVLMMLFGAPFAVWCAYILLVPGEGHPIPYDSPKGFNVAGPYKYIRNPFFLGWLIVLWGEVVFFCSIPLLVYASILSLCIHFWVIALEEPSLEDRYRNEYRQYKEKVPRWLPRIRKRSW